MTPLEQEGQTKATPLGSGSLQRVLYITFDGLLEPLGHSQVLRYLFALSQRGFAFTVISLEREHDMADARLVQELEQELIKYGVRWIRLPFRSGGVKAVMRNCYGVLRAALRVTRRERIWLVHARSYVPAITGWILYLLRRIPFIFDMRGYWIDELVDEGRWFTNPVAYKIGKWIERRLLKDSVAIVTLTQLQANDLRAGLLKDALTKPIMVITTCADYEEFDPDRPLSGSVPVEVQARLQGKLVVGLVGSINASYRMAEAFTFFRYLLDERPDAKLLCLTQQASEMKTLLKQHSIPEGAYILTSARHQEMSEWLRYMDWAVLFLNTRYAKRGSMPTKLAEFFSAGVRPIQHGCNAEVSEKVLEAGSGIVLGGLSEKDLRAAAKRVAMARLSRDDVLRAREITRTHFSLEAGVAKYETLLTQLISQDNL
jgi:glycosyltransferase involved in cell wall biosynthesis